MTSNYHRLGVLIALFTTLSLTSNSSAHFMVAQHGTLNFVEDGVYMVLSLPMSAFDLEDSNSDGAISMIEFNQQRARVVELVRSQVTLFDEKGEREILGLMLSPELDHETEIENISQLVVMGKFNIGEPEGSMQFKADLFGDANDEQQLKLSAKRKTADIQQDFVFMPGESVGTLDDILLSWN